MTDNPLLVKEIERLISRYGRDAVRDHVKRHCKKKHGRKSINDFQPLMEVFEKDARDWLEGRDPIKMRSNYSIAREHASSLEGACTVSTHQRIEQKLRKERSRAFHVAAFWIAERELPYKEYFEVTKKVVKFAPEVKELASLSEDNLKRYQETYGEPSERITIAEISEQIKNTPIPRYNNILQKISRLRI